ncbi:MAG: tetratricopeptide repeat protein, partial [Rhodospirillales bacterium]|nr:tetratricopeptide repeat protein [Rhodospirillales bacterium]
MTRKSFGISGSVDARLDVSGYRAAKREDPIPSDPTGAFREAVTFLQKGRHVGAEARCRYVVEKQPAHGGAWHMLGVLALGKNQPSEALACFEKALASMPENPDILINMGIALTGEGRQDEAIEHFQRAVELRPDHGDGHFNLGIALLHRLDSAGAVRHLGKAARLMPANADAHMNLGLAVLSRDGAAAALGHLREAVRLAPGNATARGNLASALFDINACEESLAEFDQAITLNPTICHIHFGRAKTLNRLRRSRQAVAAYERAIKLDPHFVPARNNLAQVLMQRGRFEDAEDHLRQALAQQPKEREIRLNLAALLAATGRVGEATIQCESLEQEHPDWFDAYLMHISILQEAGEFARAREIIAILRELTSDPCIRLQAAAADHDIEISDRDLQGAALAVEEGRLPEKNAGRICFILGRTFERRGEYDRSFGFYRRGNEIRNREHEYDAVTVSGRNNRLMGVFDAAFFAERGDQGLADDRPIFIVGMMRSGTSLVEQIIA